MRWPWHRARVKDEAVEGRIEELDARHQQVLRRARRVFSVASADVEKLITDDYARADQERRG